MPALCKKTGIRMKVYQDRRIKFNYPEEFRLTIAKEKYGQYGLEKALLKNKTLTIIIDIVSEEAAYAFRRYIRNCPLDEFTIGDYYESVVVGGRKGIGHVVISHNQSHEFLQKRYCYLLPLSAGGLHIEVIGDEEFEIDSYKELLESIEIQE
jgi:hypothetical protein